MTRRGKTRGPAVLTADRTGTRRLATRYAHENLTVTDEGTWVWFDLDDVNWEGAAGSDRDNTIADTVQRLVDVLGHRIVLTHVPAPWNADAYLAQVRRKYPTPITDQPGARTRDDLIESAAALPVALGSGDPVIVLGVRFTTRKIAEDHLPLMLGDDPAPPPLGNLNDVRQELRRVAAIVARDGLHGAPLSEAGLAWVMQSCLELGHDPRPIGSVRHHAALPAGDTVRHGMRPNAAAVPVHVLREDGVRTRHVCVRRVGQVRDRDSDALPPLFGWLTARRVPWTACFDVHSGDVLVPVVRGRAKVARDTERHDRAHGVDSDEATMRGITRSREILAEVTDGDEATASRVWGVVLVATSGETPQAAVDAMEELAADTARHQKTPLESGWGMDADAYRFVPGEPFGPLDGTAGSLRRWPLATLAGLGPAVTGKAGDTSGFMMGAVAGSARPYILDTHAGPRNDRPGTIFIIGEQGAAKTATAAAMLDWDTTNGIQCSAWDPTGRMRALARLPHLRADAVEFPLTTAGKPGMLMPHFLDLDPKRRHYEPGVEGDEEWEDAMRGVRAIRMDRAIDAALMMLPERMGADPDVLAIVEAAVGKVGGEYGTHSREIIDAIERESTYGRDIAERLRSRAMLSDGAMVFPDRDVDPSVLDRLGRDAALTVITTPGLSLPQSPDPSRWTKAQRRSLPILVLGWQLAARNIWASTDPTTFFADEMGVLMGGFSSVRSSILRLAYDSRKVDAAAILAAQTPHPILEIDPDVDNLVGAALLGRCHRKTAERALPLLGLEPGHGWEDRAPRLETGEFVVSGFDRVPAARPRQVRVDRAWWHPDLIAATDTTPGVREEAAASPLRAGALT